MCKDDGGLVGHLKPPNVDDVVQPHALTLPCPHRRPALKEIKRSELLNVTSIEQVSGAALSLAELSAVFCIMPKLDTDVR